MYDASNFLFHSGVAYGEPPTREHEMNADRCALARLDEARQCALSLNQTTCIPPNLTKKPDAHGQCVKQL
jgi:hypothetical protein